ncbi:MAG: triple tyrosine motif-containing protein [Balneolaceae bacterium]
MRVDDLLAVKHDETGEKRLNARLFDTSDGMANHETNGGVFPAGWQMNNGEIWFPTMQGIAIINPSLLAEAEGDMEVHISSIRFGNNEFSVSDHVSIPPGVHNLEIHYVSFDYKKPHTINYRYRLRELGDEWQSVENRNVAYFTALNPGSYTFEVTAEQFGVESGVASISFEVEPFFYQTRWFTALLLTGLFLAGYFVHLFYSKSQQGKELKREVDEKTTEIQERNQMLESLLKDLENQNNVLKDVAWVQSHELRGPLSKILGMVDVVKNYENFDSIGMDKDQLLDEIDSSAKNLDRIIRKLIADIDAIDKGGEA